MHSFLRYVREQGLTSVPEPIALEGGLERFVVIEGDSGPAGWAHQHSDVGLGSAALLLRTLHDASLGWAVGKKKADFVGKRSLARPDLVAPGRKQLVGLLTDDPLRVIEEGAQLVADPGERVPMRALGHVTSSYASANRGRSIALALVTGGRERSGQTLHATTRDGFAPVKVVPPVFFDPDGRRVHG